MKVLWIVLGVLFGLCLICGGVGYYFVNKAKGSWDDASKFGNDSFRAIASKWDIQEFQSRAAPEVAEQNGKDAIPKLIERLSTALGPLKGNVSGSVTGLNFKDYNGVNAVYADWNADVNFEKGSGEATMQLIGRNGKWEILQFHVVSPQLNGTPGSSDGGDAGKSSGAKPDEPNMPASTGGNGG
jgi:hypothetical protein